jgi:penicillin-binding protein 2
MRDHALFIGFAPADNPRYALAVVLEHNGHTVRNLDTPMIGRDIMTYMLDRERALKSLAEVEPTWGGDIRTRMAATAETYRKAQSAPPAAIATKTDAIVPSDAPAVANATDLANATQEALTAPGASVAEDDSRDRQP